MLSKKYLPLPRGIAAAIVLLTASISDAAPGDLDPTFGADGVVTTALGGRTNYANSVAQQADGKIVVGGTIGRLEGVDFALVRYNADGTPDPTFGDGGKVIVSGYEGGWVALQRDGKILAAGTLFTRSGGADSTIVRYNADGTLDPTFGEGGQVFESGRSVLSVVLQSDDKILSFGRAAAGGFAVTRYNPDGTLDPTFGDGGRVTTIVLGNEGDHGVSGAVQTDSKIVVVGEAFNGNVTEAAVVRYMPDGSLDGTFGNGGKVTTGDPKVANSALSVALQADGRIVVGGYSISAAEGGVLVNRYVADGSLDPTFGNGSKVVGPGGGTAFSVAVQGDGKIVAMGDGAGGFTVIRFHSDGNLDPTFGTGGQVSTSLGDSSSPYRGALQSDGKIVVVGGVQLGTDSGFAVLRYLGDDRSTPTFTPTSTATAPPTSTPTSTASPTATSTSTQTATNSPTHSPTRTATTPPTSTPTSTATGTSTPTQTPSLTPSKATGGGGGCATKPDASVDPAALLFLAVGIGLVRQRRQRQR